MLESPDLASPAVLFTHVPDAALGVSPGGKHLAFLACTGPCSWRAVTRVLTSDDGGQSWREIRVERATWLVNHVTAAGTAFVDVVEFGSGAFEVRAVLSLPGGTIDPASFRREFASWEQILLGPDQDGSRWTTGPGPGYVPGAPSTLLRDGSVIIDLSPYWITGAALSAAGDRLAVTVACGQGYIDDVPVSEVCGPPLSEDGFVLIYGIDGALITSYRAPLTQLLDEPTTTQLPTYFTFPVWESESSLLVSARAGSGWERTPMRIDLDRRTLEGWPIDNVLSDRRGLGLRPFSVSAATASGDGCIRLESLPRPEEARDSSECLSAGDELTLTDVSYVDASGTTWVLVQTREEQTRGGWVELSAVTRAE